MAIIDKLWRIGISFILVAGVWAIGEAKAGDVVQVVALDECDPVTFDTAFGPGTCVNVGGAVTLTDFFAALPTGHATWLFHPATRNIRKRDTLRVTNQGGEIHTFTEVAAFGGGFIPPLNNPANSAPIPECAGGFTNPAIAGTRLIQGSSLEMSSLSKGLHHFECCIHPWMRIDIQVK
jgi:hypothetical protein